VTAVFPVPVFP